MHIFKLVRRGVKMNDEELTRLAAQELMRDAKRFMDRRDAEFRATQMKQPMKTNKRFLNNTIRNILSYNNNHESRLKKVDKSSVHVDTSSDFKRCKK